VVPPGGSAAYLCTWEVPIGLFVDVLGASADWRPDGFVAGVLRDDRRRGPRTWYAYEADGRVRILRADEWIPPASEGEDYPGGGGPGRPDDRHPVQYVSARLAAQFCGLLGGRLPSAEEWLAAYGRFGENVADRNLRDQNWERQRRHVEALSRQGIVSLDWPDAGAFAVEGLPAGERGAGAAPRPGSVDRWLWFARVDEGGGQAVHHLVGNVAEYVLADGFDPAAAAGPADFLVVGGSALSPPRFGLAAPLPVADPQAGYSDVGLRVAFTAPAESFGEHLKYLLARAYVLP
jgi:hypothetical protein